MDPMSNKAKSQLARMIAQRMREDFEEIHLSGNLMNTIKTYHDESGDFVVEVPAQMYDMAIYNREGVVVTTGKGSYAEQVNKRGGFSGVHVNYAERAIFTAISDWLAKNNFDGDMSAVFNKEERFERDWKWTT